jgi:heat shock protein HslJ
MGPAMEFENQGSAILARPMDIDWNGNVLTLSNAAGRIDLSRAAG